MKKQFQTLILFAFIGAFLPSCHSVEVNGDQEAVLILKPVIFGSGGIDMVPVQSGQKWVAYTTDEVKFTMTPLTYTEDFQNIMTSDNTPITSSAYLSLQVRRGMTPYLYKGWSTEWYENNIKEPFRTIVRDRESAYPMFDLTSKRSVSVYLQAQIKEEVTKLINKLGLPVDVVNLSLGAITPPQEVLNETKNTAAQNQMKLTQAARADAELARKRAEVNKAISDKAYKEEMAMTTAEYLQLRHLEIEKEKVELIKDNKNISIIFGNATPTIPLK